MALITEGGEMKMDIAINGPIVPDADAMVYEWFGMPATSPRQILAKIEEAKHVHDNVLNVKVNSGGGSVFDASQIYTELKSFDGEVVVQIQSIAASAASVIAMAGTKVIMSPTAQIMIHNAGNREEGDYRDMNDNAAFLQGVNETIISAYALKTGKESNELQKMMDNTTWMTAKQALEAGFIDEIMFEKGVSATNSVENEEKTALLAPKIIEKVRNELMNKTIPKPQNAVKTPENDMNGGKKIMDLQTLKNEHPELFAQIQQQSASAAIAEEQKRILAIEELAMPGNEEIIAKAKADTTKTASDVAIEIIKNQKERGKNYLKNAKEDAKETDEVDPDEAPEEEGTKKKKEDEQADNLANAFANAARKGGSIMPRQLREQVGELNYENLIADTTFPVQKGTVILKAGQGMLQTGSVIGLDASKIGHLLDGTKVTKPYAVLTDSIDTGLSVDGENAAATVYLSGVLNSSALIFGGSEVVASHEPTLRTLGIYLKQIF